MRHVTLTFVLSLSIFACQSVNKEEEARAIMAQIELTERAHFTKNAEQFFEPNAESWYDVRQGLINRVDKSSRIDATQNYLNNMEFDDMIRHHDPIIEVSDDGTLGSYIGAITVKGMLNESPTFWATSWQSLFRKIDGEWKIISQTNSDANEYTTAQILLDQVRDKLGFMHSEGTSIYAYADCEGPRGAFQTLLMSRAADGRMEQIFGGGHILVKHGADTTWTYDIGSKRHLSNPNAKMFVSGHELHWLTYRPEDRYSRAKFNGIVNYDGEKAFHVEFLDHSNKPANFYYSFDTYMPLAFDIQITPQGDLSVVKFQEWGEQGDLKVLRKAQFIALGEVFNYTYTDIRLNTLDDADFESREALIKPNS